MKTREKILHLRIEKKSYNEISKLLNISKATVSYHCKNLGLNNPIDNRGSVKNINITEINNYYKNHTLDETAIRFNISRTTVVTTVTNKHKILTDDQLKNKNYQRVKRRRQFLKEKAVEYKGGKCKKCGYNKCIWSLEFHHINPEEKESSIARYSTLSWDKIKIELDKCIMVCANCHGEIHFEIHNKDTHVSPLPDKQLKE